MSDFNLTNFVNSFAKTKPQPNDFKSGQPTSSANSPDITFQIPKEVAVRSAVQKAILQNTPASGFRNILTYDFKMNQLESGEKSLYMKDLMNLPKDLEEALVMLQNNVKPAGDISKLLATNIDISALSELMQKNGKDAMNKLILSMAEASKQGITDTSQLKDAIKYINASVSVAGKDNPNLIIKNFMLLYLPWLPLREGVDFDLEIENTSKGDGGEETSLTILISTINYGNVKITIVIEAQNSINIVINCSQEFPKQELLKRINGESQAHAIHSVVAFEQNSAKPAQIPTRQAKVSLSDMNQVNPYLLLMANALIRNTIELDNLAG